VVKYAYDAWGNHKIIDATNAEIASTNRILYRSYYYDHETKLYYLNARYYNPQWRRFISPSLSFINPGAVNGLNSYTFMGNKPIDVGYVCSIAGKYTHSVIANFLYDNSTRIANARSTPTLNSECLTVVPRWVDKFLTAIDHSFSIINPIRTASYISKYPNLWNLMRLDGVADLPGALSKTATGIGWGICAVGGAISGYEKYASGASLISSIAGGVINAGISIGGMYAATGLASYGMGLLIAANAPGGIVVVSGAIIAIGVGALVNHLATEVKFMGNTLEDHINNIFDWLIFWD
jgi:RHS repeat-associated protein